MNTWWKTSVVFAPRWPGYTFMTVYRNWWGRNCLFHWGGAGFRPTLHCFQATSEPPIIVICPGGMWLHEARVPSKRRKRSEICSPLNRGVETGQTRSPFMHLSICSARSFTLWGGLCSLQAQRVRLWRRAGGHLPYLPYSDMDEK